MAKDLKTIDGCEAAARIAHLCTEVVAIFPITPSTPMAEMCDSWSARGQTNLWGDVPTVLQLQSEAGAAGTAHGAMISGALTTTFTASQGLLLMIPNMFKIAGELIPTVFHIAARTIATHALSIFGDHSDVMAARSTGWAMFCSSSVQETHDLALIAHAATLECRVPFMHFFDGFRTSHELNTISLLDQSVVREMIDENWIREYRERGLNPEKPVLRGSAQNPDVFFQAREAANPFYLAVPGIVQGAMDRFARLTGRHYKLFDYVGSPDAERVVVIMGSGAGAVEETVAALRDQGEKVGLLKVRLYRPMDNAAFLAALPPSVKTVTVLDRTKEPGANGDPLYQDVITALVEDQASGSSHLGAMPRVTGGRYGLSSKEFNPAMVLAVFREMERDPPKNHFTVGIVDDVTHTSLEVDRSFSTEPDDVVRAVFYGLGSDGTVGASKSNVKIIGAHTDLRVQGYFVYDSKKAGSITCSHLRFGPRPIISTYLIERANFVACHQFGFLQNMDILGVAEPGGTFLLNAPFGADEVWKQIPQEVQEQIIEKKLSFHVVDATSIAREKGLGHRINTVMQTCFFALGDLLPRDEAIDAIKGMIQKSYGKLGEKIVKRNEAAVDAAIAGLAQVTVPAEAGSDVTRSPAVPDHAPDFVKRVTAMMIDGRGDLLPVSALPVDGQFLTGTTRFEKRGLAARIPIWDSSLCIQCAKCAIACPHAAIRSKVYDPAAMEGAPSSLSTLAWKGRDDLAGMNMSIQVAPDDCTGCGICVDVCPARSKEEVKHKAINMQPREEHLEVERSNWDWFYEIPQVDRRLVNRTQVRTSQMLEPLFEFSSACAGCGETPYLKLATQLFGDRMQVANATGCTSIYGGNLPTTPWAKTQDGRGPAWANSLYEDNAEFGLGMRLAIDQQKSLAERLVKARSGTVGDELAKAIIGAKQDDEPGIHEQRLRVAELKKKLEGDDSLEAMELLEVADCLIHRSLWIIGGDGWAYDIGFSGLDHAFASGRDLNIMVLDTEVFSNTGGQSSKSTPRAAVAKFAATGKRTGKKDLGMIAVSYGNVYVAQVASGANDTHTVRAMLEAESWHGPSLILAYSHCVAHGIDMGKGMQHQKAAVDSAYWPLYRYDPRRAQEGKNPFQLDSKRRQRSARGFMEKEARFMMLNRASPDTADAQLNMLQQDIDQRWHLYEQMAEITPVPVEAEEEVAS